MHLCIEVSSTALFCLQVLVTSNDSRIRLYDLRDLTLTCKYRGCTNNSSQIKASFRSTSHCFVLCLLVFVEMEQPPYCLQVSVTCPKAMCSYAVCLLATLHVIFG